MSQKKILTAIYDLKVSPVGFDFVTFMAIANALRLDQGLESYYVLVIPGEGAALSGEDFAVYHDEQFAIDHAQWRIMNVFLPMFGMAPNCCGVTFCQTREHGRQMLAASGDDLYPANYEIDNPPEVYWTDFESTIMANTGYEFPSFEAPKQALDYVDQWLNQRQKGRKTISITMREGYHGNEKNSDVSVWVEFAKTLDPEEYFIVFLPDIEMAFEAERPDLEGFTQFTDVVFNLLLRMAFNERCYLSLFTSCGPISNCYYNGATRFINFRAVPTSYKGDIPFEIMVGLDIHDSQPWSTPYQKRISAPESFDLVSEEFDNMVAKIEANKEEAFSRLPLKQRDLGPENLTRVANYLSKDALSGRAINLCHRYIERHPDQIADVIGTLCRTEISARHLNQEWLRKSLEIFEANSHLKDNHPLFSLALIKIQTAIGIPEHLDKLIDMIPQFDKELNDKEELNGILFHVAVSAVQQQKLDDALLLIKAAEKVLRNHNTLFMLGMIYEATGNHMDALPVFEELAADGNEDPRVYQYLADLYKHFGEPVKAADYMMKGLARNP